MQLTQRIRLEVERRKSFLLYIAIGFTGFFIDLLLFVLLVRAFQVNPYWANLVSTTAGITNNFLLNAYFNFKKTNRLLTRFLTFYVVGLAGIAIGDAFIWIFNDFLGRQTSFMILLLVPSFIKLQLELVKVGSLFVVAILQYTLNKRFSFREIPVKQKIISDKV